MTHSEKLPDKITSLFSVIVICYNQERTIAKALDSVLRQKCDHLFEIIIGDDSSSDSTRKICEQYAEQYPDIITLLPEECNLGLVRNYFRCLKVCRGEYITDCAGDDEWIGDSKLSDAARLFAEYPEANVVYSDFIINDIEKNIRYNAYSRQPYLRWNRPEITGEELLPDVINHVNALPYVLSAAVYRKECVEKILNESPDMICNPSFGCEDVPIMAALASCGSAVFNPEVTFLYNIVDGSISNSSNPIKSARFYLKSLRTSRILSAYYHLPQSQLKEMFEAKRLYLSAIAFDTNDNGFLQELKKELREWSLTPTKKTRLYLTLIQYPSLNKIASTIKALTKRLLPTHQ